MKTLSGWLRFVIGLMLDRFCAVTVDPLNPEYEQFEYEDR